MKDILVWILGIALIWFGSAIVRLEQFHNASTLHACGVVSNDEQQYKAMQKCLNEQHNLRSSFFDDLKAGLLGG